LGSILENAERLSLPFVSTTLSDALSESKIAGAFQQIIGAIAFVEEPFTPRDLDELLNLEHGEVTQVLSKLRSVTVIPITDDEAIEPLPQSLLGYLMDSNICQNPDLIIDQKTQHMYLANACLNRIGRGAQQPVTIKHDNIVNGRQTIPLNLRYACLHWVSHLTQNPYDPTLAAAMDTFFSQHVLYWLEVMSWLKLVRKSLDCFQLVRKWLSVSMPLHSYVMM
jgi:hypothetical protein